MTELVQVKTNLYKGQRSLDTTAAVIRVKIGKLWKECSAAPSRKKLQGRKSGSSYTNVIPEKGTFATKVTFNLSGDTCASHYCNEKLNGFKCPVLRAKYTDRNLC